MREELIKRLKSFAWQAGCVGAIAVLSFITDNLAGLGLSPFWITAIGLVISQATKWLSNNQKKFGSMLKFKG